VAVENLNLYRSASRHDSFVTTTQCAECENLYVFVELEGVVSSTAFPGSVPLNTVLFESVCACIALLTCIFIVLQRP
jgi:hypothetical protein